MLLNENGDAVMNVVNDGNGAMFSLGSFDAGGRDALEAYLKKRVKDKRLDKADADLIKQRMNEIYDVCKEYEGKHLLNTTPKAQGIC